MRAGQGLWAHVTRADQQKRSLVQDRDIFICQVGFRRKATRKHVELSLFACFRLPLGGPMVRGAGQELGSALLLLV